MLNVLWDEQRYEQALMVFEQEAQYVLDQLLESSWPHLSRLLPHLTRKKHGCLPVLGGFPQW